MAETPPSVDQLRQEHVAAVKSAFLEQITHVQTMPWRSYGDKGFTVRDVIAGDEQVLASLHHDPDVHRWEDEGGLVPTEHIDFLQTPNPNSFMKGMMSGLEEWQSDGQFYPVFASRKMKSGNVVGYVVATYDDHSGSFSMREYDLSHKITKIARFDPKSPDRRDQEDALTLSLPLVAQGDNFIDYTYLAD